MACMSNLEELMNRDRTVMDCSISGKCSNCGNCCNDIIPLTNSDINRIKNYIKKNNIKPCNHSANFLLNPTLDAVCPFRDEENMKCTIYPVRPDICRSFTCHNFFENFEKRYAKLYKAKATKLSCRMVFFGND